MKRAIFLIALCCASGCAFESEDPTFLEQNPTVVETKYIYKVSFIGSCSFLVKIDAEIPDEFAHYRDDYHYFAIVYDNKNFEKGILEKGSYTSNYRTLETRVSCVACNNPNMTLMGYVAVLDDKMRLLPWGWGDQRPPLTGIKKVTAAAAVFYDNEGKIGGVSASTEKVSGPVLDEKGEKIGNLEVFSESFSPSFINGGLLFNDEEVAIDLEPACEVLRDSGILVPR